MKTNLRYNYRQPRRIKPAEGQWVILVHGLLSSSRSMARIEKALLANGYNVINFGYDSRKHSIRTAASMLGKEISASVPPYARALHFVTHSLGSIIVRYYLAEHSVENMGRFIMIAPPNHGSLWGKKIVKRLPFFKYILGIAGKEIQRSPGSRLPQPPPCEFGIIAGGTGNRWGLNPLIPGDNDATICVSETRLEGMKEHILVKGQHTMLLFQKRVIDNVISFLGTGKFIY